jgi:UDP-galactopyranose mutase
VVGAGFAGAVHARELAEAGYHVDVIDRRTHIAGNAYDYLSPSGVRVHCYGPHLFHTNNAKVVDWLSAFGNFVPYEHKVEAALPDGRRVPLPVNRRTINAVFDLQLANEHEVRAFLQTQAVPIDQPANAAEHLMANIGKTLTDLFFRPYTRKMWALDLEDLDAAVVKRIPIRYDDEDCYFPSDRFQMLPRDGYTAVFERILDHPSIRVTLGERFNRAMLRSYAHCFNSMPIDEYFDEAFGPLPYRSIRFHHKDVPANHDAHWAATVNYTDGGKFTSETDWSRLPGHIVQPGPSITLTREEPCDYVDNAMERYYPVKTSDGRYDATYRKYAALAEKDDQVSFIGRCGTYQYLDMHQVINQSLQNVRGWISNQPKLEPRLKVPGSSLQSV